MAGPFRYVHRYVRELCCNVDVKDSSLITALLAVPRRTYEETGI